MQKKFYLKNFGCQMNVADSQRMSDAFVRAGFEQTSALEDADAVLVNTCTVREHAEHRALSYIGRLRRWKEAKPQGLLIVAGCAAQRLGQSVRKRLPFVDLVVGAKSIDAFPGILKKSLADSRLKSTDFQDFKTPDSLQSRHLTPHGVVAYVPIMRGCDHSCSYCIVPSVRGKAVCRTAADILKEADEKASLGAAEIVLLGQTVNAYKCPSGKVNFAGLLRILERLGNIKRIRFMSSHPRYIDDDTILAVSQCSKVASHIHLPVQSGSNRILKLMRRGYTREDFLGRIDAIRKAVPDIALSTDFIVGFPSEAQEDFQQTLSLAGDGRFSFAYCFKYSSRQGTPAADESGLVPARESEERLRLLLEIVRTNARQAAKARIGRTEEVLLETQNTGRTPSNFHVMLDGQSPAPQNAGSESSPAGSLRGEIVKARICGISGNTLIGRFLK